MFKKLGINILVWLLKFKFIRAIFQFVLRTFVSDCPLCHHHFFGFHEYKEQVKIGATHYRIVCHRCVQKHLN